LNRILEFALGRSRLAIAAFAVVSVFMAVGVSRLKIDYSIDSFYPEGNPVIQANNRVRSAFGVGETEIAVLYADDVFAPGKLRDLRELTRRVEGLDGVVRVVSLANAPRMREEDGVLVSSEMVESDSPSPEEIAGIKDYLATSFAMKDGLLAAKDGKTTTVVIQVDESYDESTMVRKIDAELARGWSGRYETTGVPVLGAAVLAIIKGVPLLAAAALAVILAFLALNFRSAMGVVLPLVQLSVGLLWGVGILGWKGDSFVALMAISPIAILAVGSSFSLHLLGRYFLELSLGRDKATAIRNMLSETGRGVLVSGLAISASMLTFLLSELDMIRGMGLLTAVGVFSCMLVALVLIPALLNLLPAPKVGKDRHGDGRLSASLRALGKAVAARPKPILAASVALFLVSAWGIFRIVPDSSLVAYFPKSSQAIRGMRAVEETFGGSMQIDIVVDGDLQDPGLLAAMLAFQERARTIPGVGPVQSLATTVRTIHEALTGEKGMPSTREQAAQELLVYQASGSVDDVSSMANLDYTQGLIAAVARQASSRDTKIMISRIEEAAKETIGGKASVELTGDGLVMSVLESVILKDFIVSLTLAIALVLCIDSLIRSLRAAVVTITVLVFTIALQYGVLGIAGLTFTMATALMGALAIGVGDYAIHFTVRYMEDRRNGRTPEESAVSAVATSGRSILFTSLTLGGGFAVLAFADFPPVAVLGELMVFTVIAVGAASLTLLPSACLVFLRKPYSRLEVKK
jgi:uncharacterized protein